MSKYWICEYGFESEDKSHKGYSMKEVDCYAFIPPSAQKKLGVQNHRLTVWKNLTTGEYELISVPMEERIQNLILPGNVLTMISNTATGDKYTVVIKSKDLAVICEEASGLQQKYWGHDMTYLVCTHDSWEMSCDRALYELTKNEEKGINLLSCFNCVAYTETFDGKRCKYCIKLEKPVKPFEDVKECLLDGNFTPLEEKGVEIINGKPE